MVWWASLGLIGFLLGAILDPAPRGLWGLLSGVAFGVLIARQRRLARRLDQAERTLAALGSREATAERHGPAKAMEGEAPLPSVLVARPPDTPPDTPPGAPAGVPFYEWPRRWLTEGNLPVKVGVLVLFAGVGALLKYASDEGWLSLPIELRLIGISLAATGALLFGFRQRLQRRAFGLSLQGGAIGILALAVFAAFRLYGLLPAGLAFGLLVVLVAGAGILSVLQHAKSLAVLGTLAGFAAPLLVSDGSGSHVALFSWYAVLNAGIFSVAWLRAWRTLNLLGFVSTFAVASTWGVLQYEPGQFATTEPFLILFFAFYLAIPILYARQAKAPTGLVDGTLVFGTPLFSFGLQALLLRGEAWPLAGTSFAIALISLCLAAALSKRERLRLLGQAHAVVAVGFATLTVPIALGGQVTACVFALEGAGLVWLGLRQRRLLAWASGLALQVLAALAWTSAGRSPADDLPWLNGTFFGALLLAVGGCTSAWLVWTQRWGVPEGVAARVPSNPPTAAEAHPDATPAPTGAGSLLPATGRVVPATLLALWGLLWWCAAWIHEFDDRLPSDAIPDAWLAFAAFTAFLAAGAFRLLGAGLLPWIAAAGLCLATPILLVQSLVHGQPFAGMGLPAWVAFALFGAGTLRWLGRPASPQMGPGRAASPGGGTVDVARRPLLLAHLGWLWAWPLALTLCLADTVGRSDLGSSWAVFGLPVLVVHALTLLAPGAVAFPLRHRFAAWRSTVLCGQAAVVALGSLVALWLPGDASPLPWIPLFNPLELLAILALILFFTWTRDPDAPAWIVTRRVGIGASWGFALLTAATLRGIHHLADLPWDASLLAASTTQTSLSVVWSLVGVVGWVVGSRRGSRPLWLAGATLMGVVLLKLALIDRQHLGNLTGIVSFLAYGLLCTIVGYLAPAPAGSRPPDEPTAAPDLGSP